MRTGRCPLPCDFGSQLPFISWPFTDSPRDPKGYPWDLFLLLFRSRQCWWLSASVVVIPSHPAQLVPGQQNSPHPILHSRPGLMTPLPHSFLPTLLRWDQSWPVSGHQAHVSTPLSPPLPSSLPAQDAIPWAFLDHSHCLTWSASSSQSTIPDHRACLPQQSIVLCGLLPACCVCPLSSQAGPRPAHLSCSPSLARPHSGCCTEIIAFDTQIIIIPFPEEEGEA